MDSFLKTLQKKARENLISWSDQQLIAQEFQLTLAEAEEEILQAGFLPTRYQRNQQMISTRQQLHLFQSRVAVIGCGGLGGYILEELARLGIGQIIAIDPDVFEESNLNRQLLSTMSSLGRPKVEVAKQRLNDINPAIRVTAMATAFTKDTGQSLLASADLVVDAVDSIATRLELAAVCNHMKIPLIHGAIAGWFGQVATIAPGEETLQRLYANWHHGKGVESQLGNPSFTPAVAASLQVAEVCKLLLKQGTPVSRKMLTINLLTMQFDEIPLP